jgi:hypothetical protein
MGKESREKNPEGPVENLEEQKRKAGDFFDEFNAALNDIEADRIVDLNKTSNTHCNVEEISEYLGQGASPKTTKITKGEALKVTLGRLEAYMDYLGELEKSLVENLIIKAKTYLAAFEPAKK